MFFIKNIICLEKINFFFKKKCCFIKEINYLKYFIYFSHRSILINVIKDNI